MRLFRWFPAGPIPVGYDLRQLGWHLLGENDAVGSGKTYVLIGRPKDLALSQWLRLAGATAEQRKWMMMLDISDSAERARMLRLGFGDALDFGLSLEELEYRVVRMAHLAQSLPRFRRHGALQIDLLAREAFVAGRPVGLHPREFALLWRLSDSPGEVVGPRELIADVWRLAFRPETNSLAVHVSRLRAKLRIAGIDGLVETMAGGAYRLAPLLGTAGPTALAHSLMPGASLPIGEAQAVTAATRI